MAPCVKGYCVPLSRQYLGQCRLMSYASTVSLSAIKSLPLGHPGYSRPYGTLAGHSGPRCRNPSSMMSSGEYRLVLWNCLGLVRSGIKLTGYLVVFLMEVPCLGPEYGILFLISAPNFDPPSPHSDLRTDSAQGETGVYPLSIGDHCL